MLSPIAALAIADNAVLLVSALSGGKAVAQTKTILLTAWRGILKHSVAIFVKIALIT